MCPVRQTIDLTKQPLRCTFKVNIHNVLIIPFFLLFLLSLAFGDEANKNTTAPVILVSSCGPIMALVKVGWVVICVSLRYIQR